MADQQRFSREFGYVQQQIQSKSLDDGTRRRLFNVLHETLDLDYVGRLESYGACVHIFDYILKRSINELKSLDKWKFWRLIEDHMVNAPFHDVMDMVQLWPVGSRSNASAQTYYRRLTAVFKEEGVTWRMKDGELIPFGDEYTHEAIATAYASGSTAAGAKAHLEQAFKAFRTGAAPRYEKVIAEAVSAAEGQAKACAGLTDGDLNTAIQRLQSKRGLPSTLGASLSRLYDYASGLPGSRHGQSQGESTSDAATALLVLGSCSAFIHWLATNYPPQGGA